MRRVGTSKALRRRKLKHVEGKPRANDMRESIASRKRDHQSKEGVKSYRSKSDRWPCHVTLTEKRPENTLSRVFSTCILGQKVDLLINVTLSRFRFLLFLNSFWSRFGPKSWPINKCDIVTSARLGPKSWPFNKCDIVTLPVLGQKVDLLINVILSRLMF